MLFRSALSKGGALNIWYGHQHTTIWLQKDVPAGFADRMRSECLACTYEESGWCFVEATMSSLLKGSILQLDFSHHRGDAKEYKSMRSQCFGRRAAPLTPEATNAAVRRSSRPILAQSLVVRTPCAVTTIA